MRLIEQGRIPLLSWHHLEELLGGEDDAAAGRRIATLQDMPLIAYLRLPSDDAGLGSIAQILAAEAIAASEGLGDLIAVRNRARELLLRTGRGVEAIGEETWVWDVLRPALRSRRGHSEMVAALSPLQTFDTNQTIGELSKAKILSPEEMRVQLNRTYAMALRDATAATGGDLARAHVMAEDFVRRVVAIMPPPGTTVRELLVTSLAGQGVDESEIQDHCLLADLNRLAQFRSQLRVVASETGLSFETLKRVPMDFLPSRIIGDALREHGQRRARRPGSDLNDAHLGVLAAYCAVLYVDKRTAEDFVRARRKEPRLSGLIGEVAKAADYEALLGLAPC